MNPKLKHIEEVISEAYNKENLKLLHDLLHSLAKSRKAELLALGASKKYLSSLSKPLRGNPKKNVYVKMVAPLFLFPDTLVAVMGFTGPKGIIDVFTALLVHDSLTVQEVKDQFGVQLISRIEEEGSRYYKTFIPIWGSYAVFWLDVREKYLWWARKNPEELPKSFLISLPPRIKPLFKFALPRPKRFTAAPISDREAAKLGGDLFSAEADVFQDLNKLSEAWNSGMIKETKTGISEASVKKAQKTFGIKEFYTKEAVNIHKFLFPMRTRLLLQLISSQEQHTADPIDLLKKTLDAYTYGSPEGSTFHFKEIRYLLSYLSGGSKIYEPGNQYQNPNEYLFPSGREYIKLLERLYQGEDWISVENAINHLTYDQEYPKPIGSHIARQLYYYENDSSYSRMKINIENDRQYLEYIQQPLFLGCLAVLGALGMADLHIEEPNNDRVGAEESFFTGIKSYRLNALGRYILGITKEYNTESIEINQAQLIISSNDLMVLLDREDDSKANVMRFYAQEISPRRFLVNSEAFLKNCKNGEELNDRIERFKQLINQPKLPPNWKNFFISLKQKVVPLLPVDEFVIYQLPPDNEPLLQLIATNPEFRNIAEKAEGMKVLLKQEDVRKFKNLLKSHGYLV